MEEVGVELFLSNGWKVALQTFDIDKGHPPAVKDGYIRASHGLGWVVDLETTKIEAPNGNASGQPADVLQESVCGDISATVVVETE